MNRSRFIARTSTVVVSLLLAAVTPLANAQCEVSKLLAADGQEWEGFGWSLTVSGNVAVIAARWDDDNGYRSGSAYIFRFDGSTWGQEAKLLASDGLPRQAFGTAVGMSGNFVIVGTSPAPGPDVGSTYIYRFDGSSWVEEAKLTPPDGKAGDVFGCSVGMCGNVAVVGAEGTRGIGIASGAAYVYRFDGANWVYETELTAADSAPFDFFGCSVAIADDTIVVGAYLAGDDVAHDAGAAYVFTFDGSEWSRQCRLTASSAQAYDHFGLSVTISEGTPQRIVVGAADHFAGAAYIFRSDGSAWTEEAALFPDPDSAHSFGGSTAILGNTAVVGAYNNGGAAYVYHFDGANWQRDAELHASDGASGGGFGRSVALHNGSVLIGATAGDGVEEDTGAVYALDLGGPDCNRNSKCDSVDITDGTSSDTNDNGIPDECECVADLDNDGYVGPIDLEQLLEFYGATATMPEEGDLDFDGDVDLSDLAELLGSYDTFCE